MMFHQPPVLCDPPAPEPLVWAGITDGLPINMTATAVASSKRASLARRDLSILHLPFGLRRLIKRHAWARLTL
jgi:hypothetical protein